MILYSIVYLGYAGNSIRVNVVASTVNNAWTAVQAADANATSLQSYNEVDQNVIIGS
jgi:hypothetical protein